MKRVDFDFIEERFPDRPDNAHKGTMGTLVALTGSKGFSGAAVMAAQAALRSGVGLVYQILPECIYPIFASSVHEAVCVPVKGNEAGTLCKADINKIKPYLKKASAVLIGCGLGNSEDTAKALDEVMHSCTCPIIIDADGINALGQHIYFLEGVKSHLILTPHVKEFSEFSQWYTEEILESPAAACAEVTRFYRGKITIALKGHRTYIARGKEIYENIAGNSGMAKGGSGDVLAGIIASLAAQGADPFDAAVMGVHIHALAGDLAAAKYSRTAMLPTDIINTLPEIYAKIEDSRDNR